MSRDRTITTLVLYGLIFTVSLDVFEPDWVRAFFTVVFAGILDYKSYMYGANDIDDIRKRK